MEFCFGKTIKVKSSYPTYTLRPFGLFQKNHLKIHECQKEFFS